MFLKKAVWDDVAGRTGHIVIREGTCSTPRTSETCQWHRKFALIRAALSVRRFHAVGSLKHRHQLGNQFHGHIKKDMCVPEK